MIKENFGYDLWENFFPFNVPGTAGEGLNMMWEAGAQKYGANIEMIYQLDKLAPGTANYDTLLYGVEVKFYIFGVLTDGM